MATFNKKQPIHQQVAEYQGIYNVPKYNPSELDWSPESWFSKRRGVDKNGQLWTEEDARILASHVPEYLQIERDAKRDGTWLKMPDGSTWTGDPRAWVIMQSKAFKKHYQDQPWWSGQVEEDVDTARFHNGYWWLSDNVGLGDYYAHVIDRSLLADRFKNMTLRKYLYNNGIIDRDTYKSYKGSEEYDTDISNPDKDIEGYNFLTAVPKKGNYLDLPDVPPVGGDDWHHWANLPYNFVDGKIIPDPKAKNVKTDDVVDWSNQLGYDGTYIHNVWDGPTRNHYIPDEQIKEAIEKSKKYNRINFLFELFQDDPVNEFISNPGFTKYLKFIEGNNGDFDINNPDKYAYIAPQNNYQQLTMAKRGMKLIPRKQYIK